MAEVGELSVRKEPAGGGVAERVLVLGAVRPEGRRTLVLLIHGYANSQKDASDSFDKCRSNLESAATQANSNLISPIFKFYWPGDTKLPVISQLSYPWEIDPRWIRRRNSRRFCRTWLAREVLPLRFTLSRIHWVRELCWRL